MGMDIQGKMVITDLAKAPHLLIAGATGGDESVCMSTLILSLLYKFRPDELGSSSSTPSASSSASSKTSPTSSTLSSRAQASRQRPQMGRR